MVFRSGRKIWNQADIFRNPPADDDQRSYGADSHPDSACPLQPCITVLSSAILHVSATCVLVTSASHLREGLTAHTRSRTTITSVQVRACCVCVCMCV